MEYDIKDKLEWTVIFILEFGRKYGLTMKQAFNSEEWAKFILLNRNNLTEKPAHEYDVVIGPIANDRVGVQLWRYGCFGFGEYED